MRYDDLRQGDLSAEKDIVKNLLGLINKHEASLRHKKILAPMKNQKNQKKLVLYGLSLIGRSVSKKMKHSRKENQGASANAAQRVRYTTENNDLLDHMRCLQRLKKTLRQQIKDTHATRRKTCNVDFQRLVSDPVRFLESPDFIGDCRQMLEYSDVDKDLRSELEVIMPEENFCYLWS